MRFDSRTLWRCSWLGALMAVTVATRADESGSIDDAIDGTKPIVDTRLRYEGVEERALPNDAAAATLRARLGFETGKVWQTALLVEGEFVWPLSDRYNSTTNGKVDYPVVADPESYEVNRLQLTNSSLPMTTVTLGRQRINLDDQRFVGNVGWRQNEQTFDSLRIVNRSVQNLTFDVAYIDQVNRVFGKESPQGRYEGDIVLANVSYQLPAGKLTGFAYSMDFDPITDVPAAARDSSRTFGARFAGERPVGEAKVAYTASYATQRDSGANPLSFDLDYYLAELTGSYRSWSLGAGIEVLEGDGAKGFTTPLATLHKFQGWADKFLATPPDGIDDRYLNAAFTLQTLGPLQAFSVLVSQHWYEAERISSNYGSELNLQLQARWRRFTGALKYADYHADGWSSGTTKFWAQLEYVW